MATVALPTPARAWSARVPWDRLAAGIALAALTAGGALLHLRALGAHYWIDEGIAVGIASHHLGAIPHVLREDGSPPLYYVLLHLWIGVFGSSERATHTLSAVLAIAATPAAYWAVRPWGPRAGLTAAAIVAFDPFVGLYADETRMYSLLLLIALGVVGAFLRVFVLRATTHRYTLAVLLALAVYTHAWGIFLGVACGLSWLLLIAVGPDRRGLVRDGVIAFGLSLVLFAPWVPTLIDQARHTGAPWSHRPVLRSLRNALDHLSSGRLAEKLLLAPAAVGVVLAAVRGDRQERSAVAVTALIAVVTLGIAFAYSRHGNPAWAERYFIVVLAPAALAVALGLGRLWWAGPALVVLVLLVAWKDRPTPRVLEHKSNVATLAAAVDRDLPRGTLVFSPQPEQVPNLEHYLPAGMRYLTPLGPVTDSRVVDWRDALARLRAARYRSTLGPAVRTAPPGTRILYVAAHFSHPDVAWTQIIKRDSARWRRQLLTSGMTHRLEGLEPRHGFSRSTVAMTLLERVRPHHRAARRPLR